MVWRSSMILVLVLVLVLRLPGGCEAQSGDADVDVTISCTSHISTEGSSLTCQLVPGTNHPEDQEDQEDQRAIESMTLCYMSWTLNRTKCLEAPRNTLSSKDLDPVQNMNLMLHLQGGATLSTIVDLKKIVRPRSPEVTEVTFDPSEEQVVVRLQTPYHKDYLTTYNQIFQLLINSSSDSMTQNISSRDFLSIPVRRLRPLSSYEVRARSVPHHFLRGSWSSWSPSFIFISPGGRSSEDEGGTGGAVVGLQVYLVPLCLVVVMVVACSVVIAWTRGICSHMWPNVPRPKHTLLNICQPSRALLLWVQPDVFSTLRFFCEENLEEPAGGAAPPHQSDPSSLWSAPCRSGEELEGSTSSNEERQQGRGGVEEARGRQGEAYVTMSSFYRQE